MSNSSVKLTELAQFDEIVDARTPAEFAEDHIPGAINCPVLDNEERARIGTLYKGSPFEARRIGGALVAINIARHLQERFHDRPKSWRPLVYCWRGGLRSGSFVTWLRFVGWQACQLEGGYKSWRKHALDRLATLPQQLDFHVICGPTGSGKTLLLDALRAQGAQVLDLEGIACHRGSVLGGMRDTPQPPQKWFETCLLQQLQSFDPARPVFIEAESRKIGALYLPEALIMAMRQSACIELEVGRDARIEYLLRDYGWFGERPDEFATRLSYLKGLVDNATLDRWCSWATQAELPPLFAELIDLHYDPLYARSQNRCYTRIANATHFSANTLTPDGLEPLAARIIATETRKPR